MLGTSPENERSTPSAGDQIQDYQSPPTQTSQQQHLINANNSNSSTPPAITTPVNAFFHYFSLNFKILKDRSY